jgi:DeoR/GlpR family transcriptional regulator of sugar metabolism
VRRDLQELSDAGLLRRVHGGALPPSSPGPDSFVERLPDDTAAKAAVAQAAIALIAPGEVISLSGGTTIDAPPLPEDLEATVIATNRTSRSRSPTIRA